MSLDKILSKAISEEMLEKELKKLESAKKGYFKETEIIRAEIAQLRMDKEETLNVLNTKVKVLRDKIAGLESERLELGIKFSADKTAKGKELDKLDVQIQNRLDEKIKVDGTAKEQNDEASEKLMEIKVASAKLEEGKKVLAEYRVELEERKKELEEKTATSIKTVKDSLAELKAQTGVSIADGEKVKGLIATNTSLLQDMAVRTKELDSKIAQLRGAEKKETDLKADDNELKARKTLLDMQSADTKALQALQQDKASELLTRERAVLAREKKSMIKERQLKEARNG